MPIAFADSAAVNLRLETENNATERGLATADISASQMLRLCLTDNRLCLNDKHEAPTSTD